MTTPTVDPDNARLWAGASVYIGELATATAPTDVSTAWGTGWSAVGFISPDGGVVQARDQETGNHYGWGPNGEQLLRRTKSQFQRTFTFQCLEQNATVFQLVNPGSPAPTTDDTTGLTTRDVMVPQPKKFLIGMELTEGAVTLRRFSHNGATAELSTVGELTETPRGLRLIPVTVILYPGSDGKYYREIDNADAGSGA